jgi:DNA-binding cell septation regulator SpoVG
MSNRVTVTDLHLVAATEADRASGLLYFATFTLGVLEVHVTVRRTRGGRIVLSFPCRHDRAGRQWPLVRPINDEARQAIEAAVVAKVKALASEFGP